MTQQVPDAFDQCPLPQALEAMGERWSFMIMRGAISGLKHFEEFQSQLNIARNILANRLARLVEKGILSREPMRCDRRKVEYRITQKGKELAPVMIALRQWGEKWECGVASTPVLCDKRDGLPIQAMQVRAHDGRPLTVDDLMWVFPDEHQVALCELNKEMAA